MRPRFLRCFLNSSKFCRSDDFVAVGQTNEYNLCTNRTNATHAIFMCLVLLCLTLVQSQNSVRVRRAHGSAAPCCLERIKLVSSWWKMDTLWYTMILWYTAGNQSNWFILLPHSRGKNRKMTNKCTAGTCHTKLQTGPLQVMMQAEHGVANSTWPELRNPLENWFGMAYMAWQVFEYCQSQEVSWATSEIVNWHSSLHVLQGSHHFFTNLNLSCFMHWFSSIYNAKCMHSAISKCEFQRSTTNPEFQDVSSLKLPVPLSLSCLWTCPNLRFLRTSENKVDNKITTGPYLAGWRSDRADALTRGGLPKKTVNICCQHLWRAPLGICIEWSAMFIQV